MAERQHPDERDVDAIFESIVARWDDPPASDPITDLPDAGATTRPPQSTADVRLPPHPPAEEPSEADDETSAATDPDEATSPVPWRTDPTSSVAEALLSSDDDPGSGDEDEGYTPPPPAPLPPTSDRLFWGAVLGLVLGPLGLLWIALARPGGFWPKAIVIGLIIGGFVCLYLRQPNDRGYDPDQGARV